MHILLILPLFICLALISWSKPQAASVDIAPEKIDILVPHKALYDIELVATRSGSQISNIGGKMYYEWKPSCDAWITDHRFSLVYEYADSPAMQITSDFSTHEDFDGGKFNFSARRSRDGDMYQELRGVGDIDENGGKALYNVPEKLKFELSDGTMFPMTHTLEQMISSAYEARKYL